MKAQYYIRWRYAIVLLLFFSAIAGYGQTGLVSTRGDHLQSVEWVDHPNGLRAIVAGAGGVLMYSDDLGITWHRATINTVGGLTPSNRDITNIAFRPNTGEGVAVGGYREYPRIAVGASKALVLYTTDYGTTWTPANSQASATTFNDIAWVPGNNSSTFIAVGAGYDTDRVFRSTDGGQTWGTAPIPDKGALALRSVAFNQAQSGNYCWLQCQCKKTPDLVLDRSRTNLA